MRYIISLLLIFVRLACCSQSTIYDLSPNQYHDNCFFITNLNHSFIEYKEPFISVNAMSKSVHRKEVKDGKELVKEETIEYEMNVILLNEKDIKHTNIQNLNINHCTIEMIKEHKCEEEKTGLIEVPEDLKHTVANVMLLTNGANLLIYPIVETGWYCTFVQIHAEGHDDEQFPVKFEVQQSVGELTVHGYEELETGIIMLVAYLIVGCGFFYYNNNFAKKLNLKDYSMLVKLTRFQRIQNLLYKYCVFNAILFLVTLIRYSIINVTTYNHDYVALKLFQFCELSSNTIFAIWIVYQVLLFSDGFNLINNKKNSLLNIITTRFLTLLLFASFIIFDLEESSIFSIQSYLSDFFKPFAEKNEINLNISEIGGWIIYFILFLIMIKIVLNTISTVNLLRYKNAKLIKRFTLSLLLVLMTPIDMFFILPMLSSLELELSGGDGYFYSGTYFVFTSLPFGVFLNFLNFIAICYLWKGADLSATEEQFPTQSGEGLEDEEDVIELNKL